MFMLRRIFLAGLISTACSQPVWAAGLLEVYQQALISDPQLKEAEAQLLAARETRPQARARLLPEASVSATRGRDFNVEREFEFGAETPVTAFDTHSFNARITQPIFRHGDWVRLRQADSVIDQAEADFLTAQQDLIIRVSDRYFGVLSSLAELVFRVADRQATARQLEQARRRFEVGLVTITDVHEAQARYDLTLAEEIAARNQLADSREALREVTSQYYQQLDNLGEEMPLRMPQPDDPSAWVTQAMAANPQVLSASFGVEIAREEVNIQQAGHAPTLDLVASYDDTNQSNFETQGNNIRLQLSVPLFEGGAVVSRTREAAHRYEAARQTLENQQRSTISQVRNSFRGVDTDISRVNAFDQARVSTRSALEATEAGFEVGTRTIVDVLDAQRNLFSAQRDYAQSRYDYILNLLRLKQAAGQINEADLAEISSWLQVPVTVQPSSTLEAGRP